MRLCFKKQQSSWRICLFLFWLVSAKIKLSSLAGTGKSSQTACDISSRSPLTHGLPSPSACFLQDTSQPWCGRTQRRWGWGRHLPVTGPPLWWPDTSQQGMLSTLASSKKMFCLQRSNLWSRTGRCESKNTDVKCPRTMSDSYVSVPVDVCAWCVMHVGIAWAHFVDIQLTD